MVKLLVGLAIAGSLGVGATSLLPRARASTQRPDGLPERAFADPGAGAITAKRCPGKRIALKVSGGGRTVRPRGRGRLVCVRLPHVPSGDNARLGYSLGLLTSYGPPTTTGRVKKALQSVLRSRRAGRRLQVLRRRLLRAFTRPVLAKAAVRRRARRVRAAGPTETRTTTEDGVTVKETVTGGNADEFGVGISRVASGEVDGALLDEAIVKKCPDAEGRVPGDRRYKVATSFALEAGGSRVVVNMEMGWDAKLEGHVGDDARTKDFEYDATGYVEGKTVLYSSTGRLIARSPTRVYRWALAREGIDPRNPTSGNTDWLVNGAWSARGPKGSQFDAQEQENLTKAMLVTNSDLEESGSNVLLQAELGWYDDANCLKAEFTPDPLPSIPGQSVDVETRARQVFENVEVPIRLRSEPRSSGCGGSVTPQEAEATPGTPARFTYAAPDDCGGTNPWTAGFSVEGTSRRGRVEGAVFGTYERRRMPKAYVGSVSASADNGESWEATDVTFQQAGRDDQYELVGGAETWSLSFTSGTCTTKAGPADFSLNPTVQDGYDSAGPPAGAILWDFSTGRPRYTAWGTYGKRVTGTLTCPEGTFTYPHDALPWWFNTGDPGTNTTQYREADPNTTLTGSSTGTWTASITWSWSLSPRY